MFRESLTGTLIVAVFLVADTTEGKASAAPPSVTTNDWKTQLPIPVSAQMQADPKTTSEIPPGEVPTILSVFVTNDANPDVNTSTGLRCTAFALQRGAFIDVYTAAHCFVTRSFSLTAGAESLPKWFLMSDGTQWASVQPSAKSSANPSDSAKATFHDSLRMRVTGSPPPFKWDKAKKDEENIEALIFPGGMAGESTWPIDVVWVSVPRKLLSGVSWPDKLSHHDGFKDTGVTGPTNVNDHVRTIAGGCTVKDADQCAHLSTLYKRYDDSSFVVRSILHDRFTVSSTSTAVVLPGDSGGIVLMSPDQSRWPDVVGVISGTNVADVVIDAIPLAMFNP